jgi:hypothetical protein
VWNALNSPAIPDSVFSLRALGAKNGVNRLLRRLAAPHEFGNGQRR